MTTKAIWPWVSTAALERPVVPEVKKNQQGSSYSTLRFLDACAGMRSDRLAHGFLAERALADPPGESERRARRLHRRGMIGKIAVAQKRLGAGGGGEISDLVRHQPEIGRHPDRAEPERGEHRPEHLVAILGMHQDAVALADAARGKRRRQRRDVPIDLAPGPGPIAPDEADAVAVPAGILGEEMRQVHHPARHSRHAARWRGGGAGSAHSHLRPIQTPAASSTTPATPETMPCL